ncbi:GNAT family N-acetyltransferase [Tessaracoccus sp. MC1756]|uniref:GNAT family N-acetyltransferase n=1 Tax=Tessaracoccus sp. MC1756 TaxID=2760311 RepID=UPI0016000045|nr:GNAT family N-acetyltransferase [Tessaracoccus sp. MC1756]MBB1509097.1 GNAT family N-acetyltransferase [Tessaracoccus sp. MC1756]
MRRPHAERDDARRRAGTARRRGRRHRARRFRLPVPHRLGAAAEGRTRAEFTQFYFSTWSAARPERFELLMVARQGDTMLGAQDLRAADFAVRRTGFTGSWLGREFHGSGIGTRMRQMICAFAFDELGAIEMRTEAYADNPASNRVSQKTGYREFDRARVNRLGEAATEVRYKLTREQLTRPEEPISYDGGQALRRFLGISWVSPR